MSETLGMTYKNELYNALEKCQFIEETLKMCIFSAAEIARLQLSPHFPIKYRLEDISNLPLGKLVNIFSKINNDTALHEALRKITSARNAVAHQSLLFTLGELQDEDHMTEKILTMKGIVARATDAHNNVLSVRYALVRSLNDVKRTQAKTQS